MPMLGPMFLPIRGAQPGLSGVQVWSQGCVCCAARAYSASGACGRMAGLVLLVLLLVAAVFVVRDLESFCFALFERFF